MAELPILNILLQEHEIGTLAQLPGDRNLFFFNDDYINDKKNLL
jgi:serine/threonine-protein kinase HipA